MSFISNIFGSGRSVTLLRVVPAQDGGWSLTPMENLLRGVRASDDITSLEVYGSDGVVSYAVRTFSQEGLTGMFNSYFPQSRLVSFLRRGDDPVPSADWLNLAENELALVQTLYLDKESYLPLRIFDDNRLKDAGIDPLAGVIGTLSQSTSGTSSQARMGLRVLLKPLPEDWGKAYQQRMQRRRDGDDRERPLSSGPPSAGGDFLASPFTLLLGAAAGVAGVNYWLYSSGGDMSQWLLPFNAAAGVLGAGAFLLWRRFGGSKIRDYLDEELIEAKLKSLAFRAELQIVRIYENLADYDTALSNLENVYHCLQSFDDPAGNSWRKGRLFHFDGQEVLRDQVDHPFPKGSRELAWFDESRANRTVLSARESASLWHLPLGAEDMASMERVASATLIPYLSDLVAMDADSGPVVGLEAKGREVRLPESAIRKHSMILGKSGVGKSTMIKHVVGYKLMRKAQGLDDGAIVVVDPHSDLVEDILRMVPEEVVYKVRLLDFGREDRVPGLNLVDPNLFPDRDRCVDTIVTTVKYLWETWGPRLEDLLRNSLKAVYEYNAHPDTRAGEMLTILDILKLLDGGETVGTGRNAKTQMGPFQKMVLDRCSDPRLLQWFHGYLNWPPDTKAEAVGPVYSRIGGYATDRRASVILGMRESTVTLGSVLSEGLVMLVATSSGTIGQQPAALMGGTMISLVESAIRDQERLPSSQRKKCLLVCDEFQTVTGANWEGLFAEIRKYGCSMMLATQSLARLDTGERKLRSGIMGNTGCIMAYQMAAEDARLVAPEMDGERVQERDLVNLDPHHCIVRINSDSTCYPAFSLKTLPPPDMVYGTDASVQRVRHSSAAYTVDWGEMRDALNREITDAAERSKKGGAGSTKGSDDPYAAAAQASTERVSARSSGKSRGSSSGGGSGNSLDSAVSGESHPSTPEPVGETDKSAGRVPVTAIATVSAEISGADESAALQLPVAADNSAPSLPVSRRVQSRPQSSAAESVTPEPADSVVIDSVPVDSLVPYSADGMETPPEGYLGDYDDLHSDVEASQYPVGSKDSLSGQCPPDFVREPDFSPEPDFYPEREFTETLRRDASRQVRVGLAVFQGHDSKSISSSGLSSSVSSLPASSLDNEEQNPRDNSSLSVAPAFSKPVSAAPAHSPPGSELTGVRRVKTGPLRGISEEAIENSAYRREFLETVVRDVNHDPGLRSALDKRSGDHAAKVRRDTRKQEIDRIRKEESDKADAMVQERLAKIEAENQAKIDKMEAEALAKARVELAVAMSGVPSPSSPESALPEIPTPKLREQSKKTEPEIAELSDYDNSLPASKPQSSSSSFGFDSFLSGSSVATDVELDVDELLDSSAQPLSVASLSDSDPQETEILQSVPQSLPDTPRPAIRRSRR